MEIFQLSLHTWVSAMHWELEGARNSRPVLEVEGDDGRREGRGCCLPADTELVDGLCLVDIAPGLTPGVECGEAWQ